MRERKEKIPQMLTITRHSAEHFSVLSGENNYEVKRIEGVWGCTCPASVLCKHLRTVLVEMEGRGDGDVRVFEAHTGKELDEDMLRLFQFDFRRK